MSTIPANLFVNVVPGVISAGGNALDLNGLMLTKNTRVPIGTVAQFSTATAVQNYFGPTSNEAFLAGIYFAGYTGRSAVPDALLVMQYPQVAVPAYLRGGNIGAALTLTQLKAIPAGVLTITSDGTPETSGSINLSSASSFSNAATIIETAFSAPTFNVTYDSVSGAFIFTTTETGATATMAFASSVDATATACTSASTVLTVGGTVTGSFNVGDVVAGTDSTNSLPTGCTIVNQLTGTPGGAGTYAISAAATPSNLSSCAVTSTGPTGALGTSLLLTSATGAVLSQGAAIAVPGTFMDGAAALTQNWATFFTAFDPDAGSGNTQKLAFAAWANAQNFRYAYICWDTDQSPRSSVPAMSSLGYLINTEFSYSGTCLISELTNKGYAAFVSGSAASINFGQANGRVTFAYLSQGGLQADVTDATTFTNLAGNPQAIGDFGNGYNCYAAIATANQNFVNFQRGTVSGPYQWLDSFINQIWLTNQMQLALMTLLTTIGSIPYNAAGGALIEGALSDPLDQFVTFGGARVGVALSAQQIEEVNTRAGANIANALIAQGYYILVGVATSQVRQSRGSPPITVFYVDGESVQAITLGSVLVQ